jgi:KUP system potassium uptake protein
VITTVLFAVVARERFRWSARLVAALAGAFLAIDLAFFGANVFKIPAGGWFPLVVGAVVMTLLTTWRTGRNILSERIRKARVALDDFWSGLDEPPLRVPGTAVYLFSVPNAAPPALIANHRHNHVLHERVVVVAIQTADVPRVDPEDRAQVSDHGDGILSVVLRYGFMEEPDVRGGLGEGEAASLGIDPSDVDFFLGSEQLVVTARPGMVGWREHLFAFMSRNATTAANYFGLPPDRTTIVGMRVEL